MKTYIIIENYTENAYRSENEVKTNVCDVYSTRNAALKRVEELAAHVVEAITDGDENEMSRISLNERTRNGHEIEDDNCQLWEWVVEERVIKEG